MLEERDWIAQIGHRDVPGRPALFGTTQGFLEYFNMTSLRELPELMEKRALGEIAKDMNLTLPMDGVADDDDSEPEAKNSAEVITLRRNEESEDDDVSENENADLGEGSDLDEAPAEDDLEASSPHDEHDER